MSFFTSERRRKTRTPPPQQRSHPKLHGQLTSYACANKEKSRPLNILCERGTLLAGMSIALLLTLGSASAENMRHGRLIALLSDPGSDLSGLKGDYNLQAAAALDARLYFKKRNNREYEKDCLGIGLEHAVKHHLKGRAVDVYAFAFDAACSAFFAK
jgi:hypothetical protein